MVMVTSRRLTRKTWASRQNYRAELLAIGKDSNVIEVRSSCLKSCRSDRKKGPRSQARWYPRSRTRTRSHLQALNNTITQAQINKMQCALENDGCMMDALRMHTEHGK